MFQKFDAVALRVVEQSRLIARDVGDGIVDTSHVLLAVVRSGCAEVSPLLRRCEVDELVLAGIVREQGEHRILTQQPIFYFDIEHLWAEAEVCARERVEGGTYTVRVRDILLAILSRKRSVARNYLRDMGVDLHSLTGLLCAVQPRVQHLPRRRGKSKRRRRHAVRTR